MREKRWKIALTLLLALSLLLPAAAAPARADYDFRNQTLGQVIDQFIQENKIDASRFGMGWYDIESGETFFYNGDKFFVAASMYKLPICMVYQDWLNLGLMTTETTVSGWKLGYAMESAIVYSSNEAAHALRNGISPDLHQYRDIIARYSDLDLATLPDSYYNENYASPRFMLNTLRHLYEDRDAYAPLIDMMKRASPTMCFKTAKGGYEIAHKYGAFNHCANDCGIIYADRPFLLTAFMGSYAINVLGKLVDLMADYGAYLDVRDAEAAAAAEEARLHPTALRTAQTLTVDGVTVRAGFYNIGGSSYFKLRDVAAILSGTDARFSVDYDETSRTILTVTGAPYAGEGPSPAGAAGETAAASLSSQGMTVDGAAVALTAYNIDGSNYFALRELGGVLGFTVGYDEASRTIRITTA